MVWVQGKTFSDGSLHAAGKNQPPVHVIADTTKAGYNTLLNRDFNSDQPAPANSDLANQFPTPADAVTWITGVLGDQNITTCTDSSCKAGQGTVAGRGLLPWMTICTTQNNNDCVDTLNQRLQDLVSGSASLSKDNLLAVSADDLVISPTVIHTVQGMDVSQQGIVIHKIAQEVAMQRMMEKAFMARDILQTGRQAPAIAVNRPAQFILQDKMTLLDSELRSLSFEAQVRKQMMSDTLLNMMDYANGQQGQAFGIGQIHNQQPVMENSAICQPREVINMTLGVQSYPELYTTLLGWQMYDEIWDLLSQTGLAFLPFIGIVLRNITHPYTSQETKDAGSTSLTTNGSRFYQCVIIYFLCGFSRLNACTVSAVLHAAVPN